MKSEKCINVVGTVTFVRIWYSVEMNSLRK